MNISYVLLFQVTHYFILNYFIRGIQMTEVDKEDTKPDAGGSKPDEDNKGFIGEVFYPNESASTTEKVLHYILIFLIIVVIIAVLLGIYKMVCGKKN